tara:strand:+ start:1433 stop:2206 length:774 start_codon:yes stop_codon:yes gene_type:complete
MKLLKDIMKNQLSENASVLIIGNEILSGRTIDKNFNFIASKLNEHGISISESRTVSDNEQEIINAINELRKKYNYVFTTGGIGPTHDDVTAESVSKAFNVELEINKEAYKILEDYYKELGSEFNDVRQRMARIPKGASLIKNDISAAPGFNIENVYVFAGIPKVMRFMLHEALKTIDKKDKVINSTIQVSAPEGEIAKILEKTVKENTDVNIGSYPFFNTENDYGVKIEISSLNKDSLNKAINDLKVYLSKESINYS